MAKSLEVAAHEVEMDRRWKNRRAENGTDVDVDLASEETISAEDETPKTPRRKKQRRRQIDPTTCERDYNDEEINFMRALDEYKRSSGRMFPTCSEILEVVRGLGYVKLSDEERQVFDSIQEVEDELAEACSGNEGFQAQDDEEL